jgi:hypothetical protein
MDRWQRDERTLWRAGASGSVVLLPPDSPEPVTIHAAGTALWHALRQPGTTPEIAARLGSRFDVSADTIAHDLAPVLTELLDRGAVRLAP